MKLYHWDRMESLKLYSHGDVIVMAESIEDARNKAMDYFDTKAKWIGYKNVEDLRNSTDDDEEDLAELRKVFRQDLQKEPWEVHCGVVSVNGGE